MRMICGHVRGARAAVAGRRPGGRAPRLAGRAPAHGQGQLGDDGPRADAGGGPRPRRRLRAARTASPTGAPTRRRRCWSTGGGLLVDLVRHAAPELDPARGRPLRRAGARSGWPPTTPRWPTPSPSGAGPTGAAAATRRRARRRRTAWSGWTSAGSTRCSRCSAKG